MSEPQATSEMNRQGAGGPARLALPPGADVLMVDRRGRTPGELEDLDEFLRRLNSRRRSREIFRRVRPSCRTDAQAYQRTAEHEDVPYAASSLERIVKGH